MNGRGIPKKTEAMPEGEIIVGKFLHDDGQGYAHLWSMVGPMVSQQTVASRLGAPITTKIGDHWFVATVDGAVFGFAILTPFAKGTGKVHGLYVKPYEPENPLYSVLLQMVAKEAEKLGIEQLRHTTLQTFGKVMGDNGWKMGAGRGKYMTYEKEL